MAADKDRSSPEEVAFFIVLEGIDGSGTTTQSEELVRHLKSRGRDVFLTNEPSGGPVGLLIRLALGGRVLGHNVDFNGRASRRKKNGGPLDAHTLALLYAADRYDHLHTAIETNLSAGRHVVCDRYVLSSLAYQGLEVDTDWVFKLNQFARAPDLTIYLDVDPRRASKRMTSRRTTGTDRGLFENLKQQRQVHEAYQQIMSEYANRFGNVVEIDAARSIAEVSHAVFRAVERHLFSVRESGREPVQANLELP